MALGFCERLFRGLTGQLEEGVLGQEEGARVGEQAPSGDRASQGKEGSDQTPYSREEENRPGLPHG